jgi:hypothetical protein
VLQYNWNSILFFATALKLRVGLNLKLKKEKIK